MVLAIMTEAQTPIGTDPVVSTPASLHAALAAMQAAVKADRVPSLSTRLAHLEKLERAVIARKEEFASAVAEDWGHRSRHETIMSDFKFVVVRMNQIAIGDALRLSK
ncbi:MAG: hypothetical protein EOP08_16180 [Proteobacteria bacterium]|nr:MAG: hypothetical protein EOP08_16180 [Pseudomonadota bacterium]